MLRQAQTTYYKCHGHARCS